ncbi:venom serine protease Bi-VSP-like [Anastrepha ludens]|uniref:venom serine protease Bi-VSP-like n=1 Tax=Anastrepha ludens TaxID=28586 RepID=UPI0023B0999E|nr:venom serine protease Bi-VSP-like [Anastrepha ludens]
MPQKVCTFTVKCSVFLISCILSGLRISKSQSCVDSSLRAGNCVPTSSCPQLIQEYYEASRTKSYFSDLQDFVSSSMCGFDGNNFMVCCATSRSLERPVKSTYMLQNPVATQQKNPNVFTFQFASLNSNPSRPTSLGVNPTESSQIVPALKPTPVNILVPESSKGPAPLPNNPTYPIYSPILSFSEPNINASMVVALTRYTATMGRGACGLSAAYTNKVVGGMEARRGAYPWMVALGYRDEYHPDALKFLCAGSLISSRYVLTSGHCISALLITARLGAHDISNLNEVGAINIPIERKIVHEQYDLRHVVNDIGLVQLAVPAPETAYIGTICLPEGPRFAENLAGMNPFVAGWGAVKFQGPSSNVLRDAQVPIVSQQTCEQSYKSIFQHMVFVDKFICAGNSYSDACQGDSGGPLMMPMLEDGVYCYYIIGIVSYGYECARVGFPGVYTRLASYMPWILSHMV